MLAFVIAALMQIPAAIARKIQPGGTWEVMVVHVLILSVVSAPYVFFLFVRPEGTAAKAKQAEE